VADYQAILEALKTAVAADLPARLTTKGLVQFDSYKADVPLESDTKQLCFIQGVVENDDERELSEIIVQASLPGVERPTDYMSQIEISIKSIDPSVVGKSELTIEILPLYSGIPPQGGDGSYIQFSLTYTKELDDCD